MNRNRIIKKLSILVLIVLAFVGCSEIDTGSVLPPRSITTVKMDLSPI